MSRKKTDTGHWAVTSPYIPLDFDPLEYWGFIYLIRSECTGEFYIGKKQFHRANKYGTKIYGPSDWKTYNSSSDHLYTLMQEYGQDMFYREMLSLHATKGDWSYAESNMLHKVDAMTATFQQGDSRIFVNRQIGPVRWIPKGFNVDQMNYAVALIQQNVKSL